MRKLVILLGIPIDALTMAETLDRLEAFIASGRLTGKGHQVATVNADFVVKAVQDPELRHLLQHAHLSTADGMPLVWGARFLGVPLKERVAGADLVPALAERAAQKGFSIFFLGAAPGVADRAAAILKERHPDLRVAGVLSPPFQPVLEMDRSIVDVINQAQPDILLVAFGNPKQEKWIGMHRLHLKVPVMIGVGGSLDFIAGVTKRAPSWMQGAGLEWLHRLLQHPGRLWQRYVVDIFLFGVLYLRQWLAMRLGESPADRVPQSGLSIVDHCAVIRLQGRWTANNYQALHALGQEALAKTRFLLVDLKQVEFLDSAAIGALVGLARQACDLGGDLALVAVPAALQRVFSLLRLDQFFVFHTELKGALAAYQSQASPYPARTADPVCHRGVEWAVVKAPRCLDASTVDQMMQISSDSLSAGPHLLLDFSDTVCLASAGLAGLVRLHQRAAGSGGELRLAHCSPDICRVLHQNGLDKVLVIDPMDDFRPSPHKPRGINFCRPSFLRLAKQKSYDR